MADRLYSKTITLNSTTGTRLTTADFAPTQTAKKPTRFLRLYILQPSAGTLLFRGDNAEGQDWVDFAGAQIQYPVEIDLDASFEAFWLKANTGSPTIGMFATIVDKKGA